MIRSLRGDVGRVLLHLGQTADIEDIIKKIKSIYGSVYPVKSLLGQLYTIRQCNDEDVATWANRLGEILRKAKDRENIHDTESNNKLTFIFFDGR